jgi:glycosyltransferase involved in cell wall biosynthesis
MAVPSWVPSIAVIIPVYNVTEFVREALVSVIGQGYPALQVIVVDDGSAPEPAETIERLCSAFPGVVLVRQPHAGAAKARNRGLAQASADFVLFLDADDLLLPGSLAYLAESLQRNAEAVAVYGRRRDVDEEGRVASEAIPSLGHLVSGRELLLRLMEKDFRLFQGMVCARREALLALRPENVGLTYGEDWVLWCHLALSGEIVSAGNRVVVHYRQHDRSTSASCFDNPTAFFEQFAVLFGNRLFKEAFGAEQLLVLRNKCERRMHAWFAGGFARRGRQNEARHYFAEGSRHVKAFYERMYVRSGRT